MTCVSKSCQWLTTASLLAIAMVFVYAGLIVGTHMESWTESFDRGSRDLSSIRSNMNTIAYSMESINKDMDRLNVQTSLAIDITNSMSDSIKQINQQMFNMNGNVGSIQRNFSPQGMMRNFLPF